MAPIFRDIADLSEFRAELRPPELNVLSADAKLYETLLIQPGGVIGFNDDFVGHDAHDSAVKKFDGFLDLAVEKNCDLVLSPEYSCPWESLERAMAENVLPKERKIWILGCEAITAAQLIGLRARITDVIWVHEPIPTTAGRFLDVVCYLFKTKAESGVVKDVALLQFKTQAMADQIAWERDRLIVGETIYFLHNREDTIRLITLICSDSLDFDPYRMDDALRMDLHPYLIFHPQLCFDPKHAAIQNYRTALFIAEQSKSTEVIVLNWAHHFKIDSLRSPYGGSTIYLKSDQIRRDDNTLEANHKMGLYYAFWQGQRTNLCLLNYDEHVFHLRTEKVAMLGRAALATRNGPTAAGLWSWNEATDGWQKCDVADDGFKNLCDSYEETGMDWCVGETFTSIDRERLITLSAGKFDPELDWHKIRNLGSFVAEQDERTKRLTFVQEQSGDSVAFRNEHLSRFITLQMTILPDAMQFPPNIEDLKNDCELKPPSSGDEFRFNLKSRSGKSQGATALYVGLQPPNDVKKLKDKFIAKWKRENTRRLVIWFRHAGSIKYSHPPLATISDDGEHPASILRSGRP